MSHIHARKMIDYSLDAFISDEPWKYWEYTYDGHDWKSCDIHPQFFTHVNYRRSPNANIPNPVIYSLTDEQINSLTDALLNHKRLPDDPEQRFNLINETISKWNDLQQNKIVRESRFDFLWYNSPYWANFLTFDHDGTTKWFEHEPLLIDGTWNWVNGNYEYADNITPFTMTRLKSTDGCFRLPKVSDRFRDIKSGNIYQVTAVGKFKSNDGWIDMVSYKSNSSPDIFSRSISEFLEKFDRIK